MEPLGRRCLLVMTRVASPARSTASKGARLSLNAQIPPLPSYGGDLCERDLGLVLVLGPVDPARFGSSGSSCLTTRLPPTNVCLASSCRSLSSKDSP